MAAAATQGSVFAQASVFAGGLALGLGSAYALSRGALAPANKVSKSHRNKVLASSNKHSASSKKDAAPTSAVDQLDPAAAKGPGPAVVNDDDTAKADALVHGTAPSANIRLNALGQPAVSPLQSGVDPEPSIQNRVHVLDTKSDLSSLAHIPALQTDITAPVWLAGLPDGAAGQPATALTAIEKTVYANSDSIFVYEAETNTGGFGQWIEKEAATAAAKGWVQGRPQVFSQLQIRTGAANCIAGYLSAHGRSVAGVTDSSGNETVVSALTNVDGLVLMGPALSAIEPSSASQPRLVLQVSAATQNITDESLTVTNDFASALSVASIFDLGFANFAVVFSSTREEAALTSAALYSASPAAEHTVHVFDGAYTAREVAPLVNVTAETLAKQSAHSARAHVHVTDALYAKGLGHFNYVGPASPKVLLVVPNSDRFAAAKAVLDVLSSTSALQDVGILSVRVLRPWSDDAFLAAVPTSVEVIHVLDESRVPGRTGGLLYDEVFASVLNRTLVTKETKVPTVFPLSLKSSTQLSSGGWVAILRQLSGSSAKSGALSADEIAAVTLPPVDLVSSIPGGKLVTFVDTDPSTSATSYLGALVARSFRERGSFTNIQTRLIQRYDNFASAGGIVRSDVLFSSLASGAGAGADVPVHLAADDAQSHVIVVSEPEVTLKTYDVFASLRPGGIVLVNSPGWTTAEFEAKLRVQDRRMLAGRKARVYLLDAALLVDKLGELGGGAAKAKAQVLPKQVAAVALLAAFLRLHLGSSGSTLVGFLRRILGAAPLGNAGLDGLVPLVERSIKLFGYSDAEWAKAEAATDAEREAQAALAPRLRHVRYTGFVPNRDAESVKVENVPARATWALPAWQAMFSEAYGLETEVLRPDLPEKNWVVTVTENRRLTPVDYDRNVFHMELSTAGTDLKYEVGEALGVHGWNDAEEVQQFIEESGYDADEIVSVPSLTDSTKYESLTVFQLLQQRLDIFGKPPKRFYEELSKLAKNKDEARWLRFISSAEGSSTFKKLSEIETVTYADVLRMFPSARLPLDRLLLEVELIKPRHYSIASAQAAVGDSVHLLIVTVDWLTPSGSPRYGQCTRYLANLRPGAKVTVSLKPSVMKLPPLASQPIIMAGLGTGAAPFRAFLQARALQREQGEDVGPLVYYFGSRYRASEYLYGEELEAYLRDGVLSKMGLAFSRDQRKKIYIQDKIRQDSEILASYLAPELEKLGGSASIVLDENLLGSVEEGKKGFFYLCGPTWPVPDIHAELVGALQAKGLSKAQAEEKMELLKEEERYVLEVY
ncbi:sulfite reductase [NADPH] flavoprotein component [Tilletia horrida]|uniref:assimilatory sulfite reductase (NADPH) n=1 Tax=Tilletia horrida TaxID=155126 RepID=A0AAN6GW98_9BASI|nr:sulfite reductase [NADPH] flavoprotein component [Tilletia horrida]KAK0566463.1 sulfite reductase [NADPH] flavoprotein component [Tilletia horrida]